MYDVYHILYTYLHIIYLSARTTAGKRVDLLKIKIINCTRSKLFNVLLCFIIGGYSDSLKILGNAIMCR